MAEATGFIRHQCRAALVDLIREQITDPDVDVYRNEPREWTDQVVWLADTVGSIDYEVMGANLPRDDRFTVIVVCQAVSPGDDSAQAEERVQGFADSVMAAVSQAPTAYDPVDGMDGVISVTVANVDGPDTTPAPEGYGAVMTVAVEFHTRIVLP